MKTLNFRAASSAVRLCERSASCTHKVDQAAGVIRRVKIIGRESANGRTYSDRAIDQAARLYEGVCVNIDHPDRPGQDVRRKFLHWFGHLRNVARRQEGVFGDLFFLKSHPAASQVCEAAERMPWQFGLSHNAEGRVTTRDGHQFVESIERVRSVDIVLNPATNRGLFESTQEDAAPRRPRTDAIDVPHDAAGFARAIR